MEITIRHFIEDDIPLKVSWINNSDVNRFLHYDLPLEEDKTYSWFDSIKGRSDRDDFTIICNNQPVGLIGLLNIDDKNRKAEFYISLGGSEFRGKGIASIASDLLIREGYHKHNLNRIYLYTEVENFAAQRLFERVGFKKEGLLKQDLIWKEKKVDRYVYGLLLEEYLGKVR